MLFLMSTDHTSALFCLLNLAFWFYLFRFNPSEDLAVGSIAGQVTAGLNVQVTSFAGSCPSQVFDARWSFWVLQHERQKGGKITINTLMQVVIRVLKDGEERRKKKWITTSYSEFIITVLGFIKIRTNSSSWLKYKLHYSLFSIEMQLSLVTEKHRPQKGQTIWPAYYCITIKFSKGTGGRNVSQSMFNNNNNGCLTHTGLKHLHILYMHIFSKFNVYSMNAHTQSYIRAKGQKKRLLRRKRNKPPQRKFYD